MRFSRPHSGTCPEGKAEVVETRTHTGHVCTFSLQAAAEADDVIFSTLVEPIQRSKADDDDDQDDECCAVLRCSAR